MTPIQPSHVTVGLTGLSFVGSEYTGPPFDAYYDRYGLNATTAPYPWLVPMMTGERETYSSFLQTARTIF